MVFMVVENVSNSVMKTTHVTYDMNAPLRLTDFAEKIIMDFGICELLPILREVSPGKWESITWETDLRLDHPVGEILGIKTEHAVTDGWSSFAVWK